MIEYATDWRAAGACLNADPDLFFPVAVGGPLVRLAAAGPVHLLVAVRLGRHARHLLRSFGRRCTAASDLPVFRNGERLPGCLHAKRRARGPAPVAPRHVARLARHVGYLGFCGNLRRFLPARAE